MSSRDAIRMRTELASVGILLDESRVAPTAAAVSPPARPEVDRDQVRAILIAAGAPPGDLDWLTASCRSIDDARTYRPPPRIAWCALCGGPSRCDARGCVSCREAIEGT